MPEIFVLLPQEPDWSEPVEESMAYLTDIMPGYDGAEQRVQMRSLPRLNLQHRLLFLDAPSASQFQSDLWRLGALRVQVPLWMDASPLLVAAAPPDDTLTLDTTTRRFVAGGYALLWRSPAETEIAEIEAVDPSGLTLTEAVTGTWAADGRTFVLPLVRARLEDAPVIRPITSSVSAVDIRAESEPTSEAEGAAGTTYEGFEVWTVEPERGGEGEIVFARSLHHLDPGTGVNAAWDRAGTPLARRQAKFLLDGRAEIGAFRQFLARCKGRLVPFWIPSWNADLQMSANLDSGETELHIVACGYASGPFLSNARGRLAFILPDRTQYYREVWNAQPGDPGEEILTLDASVPVDLAKDSTVVSYLTLVRLAGDDPSLRFHSSLVAEGVLDLAEIPAEALGS